MPAEVVGRDLSTDIAVLKVDPDDVQSCTAAPARQLLERVQVGDPAIAIGNPFGYDRTVTTGIVSALQRQITAPNGFTIAHVIQTDAPINPGNSGGPLLDASGQRDRHQLPDRDRRRRSGSVGIGFAVPINTAKQLLPQLEQAAGPSTRLPRRHDPAA